MKLSDISEGKLPPNSPEYDMLLQLVKEIGAAKLVMPVMARAEALEEAISICRRQGSDTEEIYTHVTVASRLTDDLYRKMKHLAEVHERGPDIGHWYKNPLIEKTMNSIRPGIDNMIWTTSFLKGVRGALWTLHDILDSLEKGDYNPQSDILARAAMKHLGILK